MTTPVTNNSFSSSASVTPAVPSTCVIGLPAVDGANVSMLVTNNSVAPAYFAFTLAGQNIFVNSNSPAGALAIQPGQSLLFGPSGPVDASNAVSATAQYAAVLCQPGPSLTFSRGSISTNTSYH